MKRFAGILLLFVLVIAAPPALADGTPVMMTFTAVNGINDGSYYVSPYQGTMTSNGQNSVVTLFCDDFNNEVNFGQTWHGNVTPLSSSDLSNTRYGNAGDVALLTGSNPYYSTYTASELYAQAAWLTMQFNPYLSTEPAQVIALQYAIWDLFDPNAPSNAGAQAWILSAEQNYDTVNLDNFALVTNVGPLALTGQVQEFIIPAAEPGAYALLGAGLLGIVFLARRKDKIASLQQIAG
jgi:hypothetical protein